MITRKRDVDHMQLVMINNEFIKEAYSKQLVLIQAIVREG